MPAEELAEMTRSVELGVEEMDIDAELFDFGLDSEV